MAQTRRWLFGDQLGPHFLDAPEQPCCSSSRARSSGAVGSAGTRRTSACPYTAGYWTFLERDSERLAANPRMRQPLRGLDRLENLPQVVEQERARGTDPI